MGPFDLSKTTMSHQPQNGKRAIQTHSSSRHGVGNDKHMGPFECSVSIFMLCLTLVYSFVFIYLFIFEVIIRRGRHATRCYNKVIITWNILMRKQGIKEYFNNHNCISAFFSPFSVAVAGSMCPLSL